MMTALLGLSALMLLLVLLLAVPIDLTFRVEGVEPLQGHISVRWLFGLVRFRGPVPRHGKRLRKSVTGREHAGMQARRKQRSARSRFPGLLRHAAFRRRAVRFVKDLVRAAHLRQLHLTMRLGLGDPADTGFLWAILGPLNAAAQSLRNVRVSIEPEFVDPVFEFQARGGMRLIPMQLLALASAFVLSPSSLRAWRTLSGSHA